MPRGRDLIGLPVLAGPRLKRIGRVCEVLLDMEHLQICGLVLESGSWLQPRRVLDFRAVRSIGLTYVLADEFYLTGEVQTRCCQDLLGLPVLDGAGEELGVMDDFCFCQPVGKVSALQLSRGLVDDLWSGKAVIPLDGPVVAGEAAILLQGPGDDAGGAVH